MLQRLFSTLLFVFCLVVINSSYAQTVPGQMSYQGKLNDADGIPYNGSITIRFVITATGTGGVQQRWSQTQTLPVVNGLYSATLGKTGNFIPSEIFTKNNPTLSLFIDGTQLLPSIPLLSVPYSFFAEHVGSLSDDMVETQHILNGTIKLEDLESDIADANTLLYTTPAGNIRWRDADDFVRTDQLTSIQESTVANNGLNLTGRAVRLGGALIQNTAIDLNGFTLGISVTTGSGFIAFNSNGDFNLPIGTSVNNIVTVINNDDDNALATEGAVFDYVNASLGGSAGSGLSNNATNIDLGGALTIPTTITTDAVNDLTINGLGTFNVATEKTKIASNTKVDISSSGGLTMDANFLDIITSTTATINAIQAINLNANTGNINISAATTQVSTGFFGLNNFAAVDVNNIVTVINNDDDDNLVTEGAVFDAITAATTGLVSATNGLNTPVINQVALGGNLTNPTIITTNDLSINPQNLTIDGTGDFTVNTNQVDITSVNENLNLNANSGKDVNISAAGAVNIGANTNIDIDAATTQISAGTFGLQNFASVDVSNIVTLLDNHDDDNLITEGAVFDFVNSNVSKAGSGLTQNGQHIDLGGALTSNANITGAFNFDVNVTGANGISLNAGAATLDLDGNSVDIDAATGVAITAVTNNVDITANGNVNTTSATGDVNVNATAGDIGITAGTSNAITLNAENVDIVAPNGTQISAGTFGLIPNAGVTTTVDAIVTLIDDHDDDNLITEGAVFDFINSNVSKAGSGLTQNGTSIDLGGALLNHTVITTTSSTADFTITGDGNFGLSANVVTLNSNGGMFFNAASASNFVTSVGDLSLQATSNDVDIIGGAGVNISANGDGYFSVNTGDLILSSNTKDVSIAALNIDITSGSFHLPRGASVDEIATVLFPSLGSPNDDDHTLLTAKAIADFVFDNTSNFDNGLIAIITGTNPAVIGLGGTLTSATTIIDISGNNFMINDTGTGFFGIDVDDIEIISENDLDLVSTTGDIFLHSTGNIDLTSSDGDIFTQASGNINLTSRTGNIDIVSEVANIALTAQNVHISSGTFDLFSGTAVNNIATDLLSAINDNDNTLLTAKAIQDFVNLNTLTPDNGLTITTSSGFSGIGLGGTLSTATIINTGGKNFVIGDAALATYSGGFATFVDRVHLEAETNFDLISKTGDIFLQTTASQNIVLETDQVIIEHNVAATSNIENTLTLNRRTTTATGSTNGIGEKILFQIEDNPSAMLQAASLEVSLINVNPGDNAELRLKSRRAGNLEDGLILDGGTNSVILGDGQVATNTRVGIGERNPQTTLHVVSDIVDQASGASNPINHVMLIENINTGSAVDHRNVNGLAISLNVTANDVVDESNNFITFFVATGTAVGAIELTTGSGVTFSANGADYAEWLARKEITEKIEAADIVGIFGGQITKNTENAEQFRVVSTSPIVLGNRPSEDNSKATHEKIAFLGQVPVKVKGAVRAGDYIIPSGKNDGVGIAVSAQKVTASQFAQVIGMAWESSDKQNVKKINVAIGLDTPQKAIVRLMENSKKQENIIQELQKELTALGNQNAVLKSDNVELKAQAQKIDKMQSQIDLMMQMMKTGQQKEVLNAEDDK